MARDRGEGALARLRAEFAGVLSEAYETAGAAVIARTAGVNKTTVGRYLVGQVSTDRRPTTFETIGRLAASAPVPELGERLPQLHEQIYLAAHPNRIRADAESQTLHSYYAVVPKHPQTRRTYLSIDLVQVEKTGRRLRGQMTRQYSGDGRLREHRWELNGVVDGEEALFITFHPSESSAASAGSGALKRSDDRLWFEGQYSRRGDPPDHRLIHRPYGWYRELPADYRPAVALLGLSNTLMHGDPTLSLLRFGAHRGHAGAKEAAARYAEAREPGLRLHPRKHIASRRRLVAAWQVYAEAQGSDLAKRIEVWAKRHLEGLVFPMAPVLIAEVLQRGMAPVLVTAAPQELAEHIGHALGIDEAHGMKINARNASDPGVASGRQAVMKTILEAGRDIAYSLTNLSLDSLAEARVNVVIGDVDDEQEEVDAFLSTRSTPDEVKRTLDLVHGAPLFPPLAGPRL